MHEAELTQIRWGVVWGINRVRKDPQFPEWRRTTHASAEEERTEGKLSAG